VGGPAHLEDEVRQDADQVGVAHPLAVAVHGSLDEGRARLDPGQGNGDADAAVVVAVDPDALAAEPPDDVRGDPRDLRDELAPVRLAEGEVRGAPARGGLERAQGVLRVVEVAVEEMLGVVDDLPALAGQEGDGVLDHRQVLLGRRAQDLRHVEQPGLADEGHDRHAAVEERAHLWIRVGPRAGPARRAEGRQLRVAQTEVPRLREERDVAGVRARVAPLDVVDPELVQALGDEELVRDREADPLPLRTVAEGRVVDPYVVGWHGALRRRGIL
jgi:hypothetical protein